MGWKDKKAAASGSPSAAVMNALCLQAAIRGLIPLAVPGVLSVSPYNFILQ
jgi:hypothetical protein